MDGEIDAYLAGLSPEAQGLLDQLRSLVGEVAPDAVEGISYDMIGYKLRGKRLVYFGGWKGFCSVYGLHGGTLRLEFGQPIPGTVGELISERAAQIV